MASAKQRPKPTFFETSGAFRAWLEANHEVAIEVFVGLYKSGSGRPNMNWSQAVDEALCFGWIDGVSRSLGAEAWMIRFTPRRAGSIWSKVNVAKVARLRELGLMCPAGERAFAARSETKTGVYSFERAKPAQLTAAQCARLRANAKAAAFYFAQAPWYQRATAHWVISAKREETRERRLAQLIKDSAAGRRIGLLTRPADKRAEAKSTARKRRAR